MKNAIKSYVKDESALDESVTKMLFIVIGIGCAMAVGWYIWNTLQKKTSKADCTNSNSPWCVE